MSISYNFPIPLQWQWHSHTGTTQKENRDACGLFFNAITTFVVIMDASDQGENGQEFNSCWIKSLIELLANYPNITSEKVLEAMRLAHKQLSSADFLLEKACFCALLIRHDIGEASVFSCGDCRVGLENKQKSIDWISPVHSIANMFGEPFTIEHAKSVERNTVTRTLNVKRFYPPELIERQFDPTTIWYLATDGYWVNQILENIDKDSYDDDYSFLKLGISLATILDSDSNNIYIFNKNQINACEKNNHLQQSIAEISN